MSSAIKALVILSLVGLLTKSSTQQPIDEGTWDGQNEGLSYEISYNNVNNYLVENVDGSESMPANMDALVKMLNSEATKEREKIVLRKLTTMSTLAKDCNKISYEAIQDSDKATYYRSYDVTSKKAAPRRINKLINYYGVLHAQTCEAKTVPSFKPKMKLVEREVLNRLSTWLDPVIERILAEYQAPKGVQIGDDDFSSKVFYAIIKQDEKNPIFEDPELAYNAIKTFVKDKPEHEKYLHYISNEKTGVRQFSREGLKSQLFDRYISGSCDAYAKQMGDLFERIDYDAKFHHVIKSNEPNLYRAWAYWKICHETFVKPKLSPYYKYDYNWPLSKFKDYAQAIADEEENDD